LTRALVLAALMLATAPAGADTPAALAEARRCWATIGEVSIAACRRALELGLAPARASRVELTLSTRLGALGRWDEAAEVHRRAIATRPREAEARRRLGAALLHGLGRPADAETALREAIALGANDAQTYGDLALAVLALGRPADAVAAFAEAVKRDPRFLDGRAASKAAYEAARAGRPWPDPSPTPR
jgi:Flp pilus assembly protein TadD